jgi:hypothetical protein
MKTRLLCVALFAVVYTATTAAQIPKSDNQSWNDVQITVPMTKKVDFLGQVTLRLGDNISQTVDQRWGVGFALKLNKYLTLTPFYLHREARPPNGPHEFEDRLTLGGVARFPVGKFFLADRNWFERRWRDPQRDAWRYRNRIQLEHPFQVNKKKFTWFVSDEIFYDWTLHVWPRNRASAGITHPFNPHLTVEVYYTRQNDSHARPGDLNIIWSAWRIKF